MRYRGIATLFCIIFDGIFADCRKVCIFADRKRRKCCNSGIKWSDGRVARQRSAKPRTAVRIRFRPQILQSRRLKKVVCFVFLGVFVSTTHILHKNTNSPRAVALHKWMLRAIAHLGMGGCADIVFYCSGLHPALCRIRTSSGKALTSNPLQTSDFAEQTT